VVSRKFRSLYFAHLATLISNNSQDDNLLKDTAETESEVAEKSSWDHTNRWQKLGLVWRNRKKISQIINDYLYLPFFFFLRKRTLSNID
jgi:hypothetical protein